MQILEKFLLEIMMLVLSANIIGTGKVFIVEGRSFTLVTKSKGPRIDPLGIPPFIITQLEYKYLVALYDFIYFSCLFSVR
jgi:hypothetical protein